MNNEEKNRHPYFVEQDIKEIRLELDSDEEYTKAKHNIVETMFKMLIAEARIHARHSRKKGAKLGFDLKSVAKLVIRRLGQTAQLIASDSMAAILIERVYEELLKTEKSNL